MLVGIVTLAHLWAHATAPHHRPAPPGVLVVDSCADHPAHDHRDRSAHPEAFMLPGWDCAVSVQTPLALVPPSAAGEPVRVTPPGTSSRAPPRDHRGRAVSTHTLEICRR
ncbi:hypothetical protein DQ384_01915 [Sphaerisporangium album]|uniref:Uncharacterized protein n=1 Tax=Sphaerisporangium album TaxID=509200 RepID=A0A367FSK6_9ACTN|nr:hypothetical protein DQ384_01915 [Sphaerisporangium album]